MITINDSIAEWKLPTSGIKSKAARERLDFYCFGKEIVIPQRLTTTDKNGDIFYKGDIVGNKKDHPYCAFCD